MRDPKIYQPIAQKLIPKFEILDTIKKAVNGDYASWWVITNEALQEQSGNLSASSPDAYLEEIENFLVRIKSGESYVDIISGSTYSDQPESTEQFLWALRKYTGQSINSISEYKSIVNWSNCDKNEWVLDVFWFSRSSLAQNCIRYALNHGVGFSEVLNKLRFSFFGFKSNKIPSYSDFTTMSELVLDTVKFANFYGGNFEEYGDDYIEYLASTIGIDISFLYNIKYEFESSREKMKQFSEYIQSMSPDQMSKMMDIDIDKYKGLIGKFEDIKSMDNSVSDNS
jgi:hypothetical protein